MNTISYIISPFFQLTLFSTIPLISYAFQHKLHRSFAKYLGLKQAEIKNWKLVIGLLAAAIGILLFGLLVMSATNSFAHANSVGARLARSGLTLPVFVPGGGQAGAEHQPGDDENAKETEKDRLAPFR